MEPPVENDLNRTLKILERCARLSDGPERVSAQKKLNVYLNNLTVPDYVLKSVREKETPKGIILRDIRDMEDENELLKKQNTALRKQVAASLSAAPTAEHGAAARRSNRPFALPASDVRETIAFEEFETACLNAFSDRLDHWIDCFVDIVRGQWSPALDSITLEAVFAWKAQGSIPVLAYRALGGLEVPTATKMEWTDSWSVELVKLLRPVRGKVRSQEEIARELRRMSGNSVSSASIRNHLLILRRAGWEV